MPQISKIRIVNFQYNDGKRLIADELYDFESESKGPSDVLINLANGGGKSVLVQLMMQPIIPKAKVAGRRIESFFTKATDHCYVAIEWTLDGSKTKLMTGIAMAASDSSADMDSDRGFQIKYYTFISSYQNYQGNYNIITIPLSRKENGRFIPASFDDVRSLAKKSGGGLERYSSEDSTKWQERLSQYGIIQDEWRMIEELNSNEDGLSKYFSNLKTSDAVIDKLIIPCIEEKQNYAASRDDCSLETMLLSYAKQYSRQKDDIKEHEILSGFYEMLNLAKTEAEELWKSNDSMGKCIGTLFAYQDALNTEIARQKEKHAELEGERTELNETIHHIRWEKVSAEYYTAKEAFERETEVLRTAEESKTEAYRKLEEAKKKLLLLECAHYFGQLKSLDNQIIAITEEIKSRENNSESSGKLASLKYSAYITIKSELDRITPETADLMDRRDSLESSIEGIRREIASLQKNIDSAKAEKTKAETILDRQMKDNDETVKELGIEAFRMLDGKYQDNELKSWQNGTSKKEQSFTEAIKKAQAELKQLEERKEEIPQEIGEAKVQINGLQTALDSAGSKLSEYRSLEESVLAIFAKNGLDASLHFTSYGADYLKEQLKVTEAAIKDEERRIEATEEAVLAVERGTLHIPKLLSDYLDSTGLRYTSVEKYILAQQERGTLSREDSLKVLERYPFAAYGVIIDQTDKEAVCEEADGHWLPAVLPVFTAEDIQAMLDGAGTTFTSVSSYSKDYFLDNSSYAANLQATLDDQYSHKRMLEERKETLKSDSAAIKEFSVYNEKWEAKTLSEIEKVKADIAEKQEQIQALETEQNLLKVHICENQEEEKRLTEDLRQICGQLALFERLIGKLEEENSLARDLEAAERKLRDLSYQQSQKDSDKTKEETELEAVLDKLKELETMEKTLHEGLSKVSDAAESEIINDDWTVLLSQYETLLSVQSADLKRLNEDKTRLLKESSEKQKEIQKRKCDQEEYEALIYSEELEVEADAERGNAEAVYQTADAACSKASRSQAKAESSFENAADKLKEFGAEALPLSEVGRGFDARILDINKKIADIENQSRIIAAVLAKLQKIQGKAETVTEQYQRPAKYTGLTLETDYAVQLESIIRQIREWKNSVEISERKVEDDLEKMSSVYGTGSADVSLAISSMQQLLSNGDIRGDRYFTLCEHIDANMHTAKLRISQIDTDLKEFHKTKGDLIRQCVIQGKQMYEGLLQLSGNSKVKVQEKRRQMLKFDIPDAVDENIANAAIAAEIDKGTEEIVSKMSEESFAEAEAHRIAARTVGSKRLLRKYIGAENIVLKAYKIDRNPENSGYRTWEQTQVNNSGAEKFVVYFAVILALMSYTRDGYDAQDGKNNRSVLILDNPFGPISSKHVLEPMFEISRNYNVQMICLTDISKSDIVSCFDLVIRAVVKKFALSSKEQLTHEGNESIEHGFYRSEQMNLF